MKKFIFGFIFLCVSVFCVNAENIRYKAICPHCNDTITIVINSNDLVDQSIQISSQHNVSQKVQSNVKSNTSKKNLSNVSYYSGRCCATTKAGNQCKRNATVT